MKAWRAVAAMAVAALAVLGTGCSGRDDVAGGDDVDGQLRAGLYITVSDGVSGARISRAPGYLGDDYDRGEGYENYIDIAGGDFMFLFFDTRDRYVGVLDVTSVLPVESTESSKTYSVVGSLSKQIAETGNVKIMALANWRHSYPDAASLKAGMTIDEICSSIYSFDKDQMIPSADNAIPLYGITNVTELKFDAFNFARVGTIHLLRAYAKVEVAPAAGTLAMIESVTLTRYNTSGYRAPGGVYCQDDYVRGNYAGDYTDAVHIPTDVAVAENLPLEATESGSYIAYVPEYVNTSGAAARLMVHFAGDDPSMPDVVDFKYYQAPAGQPSLKDKAFDLMRNYWYRFNVKKAREVTVEVIVVPYAETKLNPDFGIKPPVDEDDVSNYYPVVNERDSTVLYYRNELNQACLTPDLKTKIDDPEKIMTPEGYQTIQCHLNGRDVIYYYYDPVRKLQLAPDKKTPVRTVFSWSETGFLIYLVLGEEPDYVSTGEDYYFDSWNDKWYDDTPAKDHYDQNGNLINNVIPNPFPAP